MSSAQRARDLLAAPLDALGFALLYALLALYWYKITNTDARSIQRACDLLAAPVDARLRPPACCFTSTKVQKLTQPGDVFVPLYYSVPFIYWQFLWMLGFALLYALQALYWYKSTNTDARSIQRALHLLAVSVDARLRAAVCVGRRSN
jgi:hypothetical protein